MSQNDLILCPLHGLPPITPCPREEVLPLVEYLQRNEPVAETRQFPRGTITPDGRLDLCKQSLGAERCREVLAGLQDNTRVRSLLLGTDGIGDPGAEHLAEFVGQRPPVEILYLGCNNIGPAGAEALAKSLEQTDQVTGLWLKRNPLGQGIESLARMLRTNRSLRTLDLVNTGLTAGGLSQLREALRENPTLQRLYLGGNGLTAVQAELLAGILRDTRGLQGLYLNVNHLADAGAATLAESLSACPDLRELGLASNGIGLPGLKALCRAIQSHPALEDLDLGYSPSTRVLGAAANDFGDAGAELLAILLRENQSLHRLDLSRTGITAPGRLLLADALQANLTLTTLDIDGPLPDSLKSALARNRQLHPEPARCPDVSLIRSVYRNPG